MESFDLTDIGDAAGLVVWECLPGAAQPEIVASIKEFRSDSKYGVLNTTSGTSDRQLFSHLFYMWTGAESSEDTRQAAETLSMALGIKFGGAVSRQDELEGQESDEFKQLFPTLKNAAIDAAEQQASPKAPAGNGSGGAVEAVGADQIIPKAQQVQSEPVVADKANEVSAAIPGHDKVDVAGDGVPPAAADSVPPAVVEDAPSSSNTAPPSVEAPATPAPASTQVGPTTGGETPAAAAAITPAAAAAITPAEAPVITPAAGASIPPAVAAASAASPAQATPLVVETDTSVSHANVARSPAPIAAERSTGSAAAAADVSSSGSPRVGTPSAAQAASETPTSNGNGHTAATAAAATAPTRAAYNPSGDDLLHRGNVGTVHSVALELAKRVQENGLQPGAPKAVPPARPPTMFKSASIPPNSAPAAAVPGNTTPNKLNMSRSATPRSSSSNLPKSEHDKANTVNASMLLRMGSFKLKPLQDFVPYDELVGMRLEDGIDATRREDYLSDADFQRVFGVDRAGYAAMPAWKKQLAKKKVHLF